MFALLWRQKGEVLSSIHSARSDYGEQSDIQALFRGIRRECEIWQSVQLR